MYENLYCMHSMKFEAHNINLKNGIVSNTITISPEHHLHIIKFRVFTQVITNNKLLQMEPKIKCFGLYLDQEPT